MAGLTTGIIDTLPDNDRFLPRYLTVKLLEILEKTVPATAVASDPNKISPAAQAFIASIKKPDLFTPLTYKIFWRENPETILDSYIEPLDDLDKYSHSALTIALSNEDFALAVKLINHGENVYLEDKIVLEIALTSMMQRDPKVTTKILAGTTTDDAKWVKEYLDLLDNYVTGKITEKFYKSRDVLNPPIRHFGQVLDTMVYFNGIPSHYGFLSPSIDILTAHLEEFVNELKDTESHNLFKPISEAYNFTQRACKFQGNLPTTKPAEELCTQINNNISKNRKDVIIVFGGCAGNAIAIAFINKTLIFSNLGIGGDPLQGTKVYAINNPAAITPAKIDYFIRGLGSAAAPLDIFAVLGDMIDPNPVFTLSQALSPIDNCIFVNPRAVIQGILLVLAAYQQQSVTSETLKTANSKVTDLYNAYLNSLYKHSTADLANFMRNHELLKNKRIECCSLALEYINQHYNDPEALQRCIELKNALEFVGLRDYYNQNITPAAKEAIQKMIIREQEITAVRVIELEYAMLAKQP